MAISVLKEKLWCGITFDGPNLCLQFYSQHSIKVVVVVLALEEVVLVVAVAAEVVVEEVAVVEVDTPTMEATQILNSSGSCLLVGSAMKQQRTA